MQKILNLRKNFFFKFKKKYIKKRLHEKIFSTRTVNIIQNKKFYDFLKTQPDPGLNKIKLPCNFGRRD